MIDDTDYMAIFDALAQFKRDHPDYVQARELLDRLDAILEASRRSVDRIVTTDRTDRSYFYQGMNLTNPAWQGDPAEDR